MSILNNQTDLLISNEDLLKDLLLKIKKNRDFCSEELLQTKYKNSYQKLLNDALSCAKQYVFESLMHLLMPKSYEKEYIELVLPLITKAKAEIEQAVKSADITLLAKIKDDFQVVVENTIVPFWFSTWESENKKEGVAA